MNTIRPTGRSRLLAGASICLVLLAGALPAKARDLRDSLTDGRGTVLWWEADGSGLVQRGEGEQVTLALEEGVVWSSLAAGPGTLAIAGRRGEDRIVLVRARGGEVERLPAPRHGASWVDQPRWLQAEGELDGLAWVAGSTPRKTAVRAAMLRPDGWQVSTVVSPPGPGTQTALSAIRLDDGRDLLLWSAFDGSDDEVLFSLGRDGAFSRPARLGPDNRTPDITPVATALEGGRALAAWSSYDGQRYRLRLAVFDGSSWGEASSPPAAADLYPSFTTIGEQLILQAKDPAANRWVLLRLGSSGELLDEIAAGAEEPIVTRASAEGLTFRVAQAGPGEHPTWR